KAELNAMKQQINPHFLFNSLNTLIDLIEDDQEKAVEFVRSFSNLYRIVLQSSRHNLILLEDELAFLNYYWELLKMRFNDTVELNIDLPEHFLTYMIPPLSLQLLVENAVKHNQFSRDRPLVLKIFSEEGAIKVTNELNPKVYEEHESGFGLQNLQKRFTSLISPITIEKGDKFFSVTLPVGQVANHKDLVD
ncbi:MAG: histidine kinase, partial [Bacteroidota bacterium]